MSHDESSRLHVAGGRAEMGCGMEVHEVVHSRCAWAHSSIHVPYSIGS